MKKVWNILLVVALMFALALPCFAVNDPMTITDVTAEPGDIVYLTVILNEKAVGNTAGIDCTYDPTILKPAPASSSWAFESVLEDFNKKGGGVWASKSAQDLQGTLCVVAFQVLKDVTFTDTTVTCTVMVKNNEKEVATYTADSMISYHCDHVFGAWESQGEFGHVRVCSSCERKETASHTWDEGKITDNPDGSNTSLLTRTCTICGGTVVKAVTGVESSTQPVIPEHTEPDESRPEVQTKPTNPNDSYYERPTVPTESKPEQGNKQEHTNHSNEESSSNEGSQKQEVTAPTQYKDYNEPERSEDDSAVGENHREHSHETDKVPIAVPINPENHTGEIDTEDTVHQDSDASHAHDISTISIGTVCTVLGALICIVAISVYFVKRKH